RTARPPQKIAGALSDKEGQMVEYIVFRYWSEDFRILLGPKDTDTEEVRRKVKRNNPDNGDWVVCSPFLVHS
ncbi:MAG TPA: hypothetical protein VHM88_01620, partial [Candidatus Acidoferrales bacterium]|nr:hypothetical protein [Candidatus Acidoferrales bacterium]